MMDQDLLVNVYNSARKYLLTKMDRTDSDFILDHYLCLADGSDNPEALDKVYFRLLVSAQNANMKAGVVGGSIGGVDKLGSVLSDFSPSQVLMKYGDDYTQLLTDIETEIKPKGKIRKGPQSIWPRYCKTILSAADFLAQFGSGEDFYSWVNHYYNDSRSIAALPLIIEQEVYGVGYPLACDFLKELGFINYGKPDVHIIDIFVGVGLCEAKLSPYHIQKIIVEIAKANNISAYNVDKLFWLIGSGKFYDHPDLVVVGLSKDDFFRQFLNSQ